jgi:hypothetical protein
MPYFKVFKKKLTCIEIIVSIIIRASPHIVRILSWAFSFSHTRIITSEIANGIDRTSHVNIGIPIYCSNCQKGRSKEEMVVATASHKIKRIEHQNKLSSWLKKDRVKLDDHGIKPYGRAINDIY